MRVVRSEPSRPLQYSKAIRESDLPTGVRAVCWAIATFADNKTGRAYPTVKQIAEAAGLSEPIVSRHTRVAEAQGYLRKDRRRDSSIVYYITVPVVEKSQSMQTADTEAALPPRLLELKRMNEAGRPDVWD